MVNTEGSPGLDFPEISAATQAAADFLNEHGGMGGRPIKMEFCKANGSPETSQACAQELAGKGVELVMLGLDLFPGYDTFTASNIPVTGVLPILPGDYTANALFLGGGNTTTTAAMAGFAKENFDATTAGIVSADNAGANGTEADLKKALDAAGITYVSIKGGDNETDAGFQGLMSPGHGRRSRRAVLAVRRCRLYRDHARPGLTRHRDTGDHDRHLQQRRGDRRGRRRRRRLVLRRGADRAGPEPPLADDLAGDPGDTRLRRSSTELGLGGLGVTALLTLATIANTMAAGR